MEIQSVAIMRWSSEEHVFAVEVYFSNWLSVIATQRAFRNCFNVTPRDPVHLTDEQGLTYHLRTLRQWELPSCNPHDVLRANIPLPLDFLIVQWGEYFMMTFIVILTIWRLCRNSPNMKDGLHTYISLPFVVKYDLKANVRE